MKGEGITKEGALPPLFVEGSRNRKNNIITTTEPERGTHRSYFQELNYKYLYFFLDMQLLS